MDKSKRLIRARGRAFTMVEIIVVAVVASILLSIITPTYMHWAERARAAEAYATFKQFREGFLARRAEGKCLLQACLWSPSQLSASTVSWEEIYMENPNKEAHRHFTYIYYDPANCANPPVNGNSNFAIVAFRKKSYIAYTLDIDVTKFIYMDLDTGEVVKSYPY